MAVLNNYSTATYKHAALNAAGWSITLVDFIAGQNNGKSNIIDTIENIFAAKFSKTSGNPLYGTFAGIHPVGCRRGVNDKSFTFHDQIFSAEAEYGWSEDGSGGTPRVQVWVLHPIGTVGHGNELSLPELAKYGENELEGAVRKACEIAVTPHNVRGVVAKLAGEPG